MNWVVAPEPGLPWVAGISQLSGTRVWSPPQLAVRLALRLSPRRIAARLHLRRALAELAARQIPRDVTTVIAPSLCARPVFAEAKRRGLRTVLIQDLPCLRRLHADLDRAASAHPGSRFLNNYRAPAWAIVEQEAEWVLADEVRVRGAYAAEIVSRHALVSGTRPVPVPVPRRKRPKRVQLAGIATPRHGVFELLEAQAELDGIELIVRTGEGLEPHDLLARRQVSTFGVPDIVVAPAWCEAHLPEIQEALAKGIPVVATRQASGWFHHAVTEIAPGDVSALVRALS